MKQLLLYFLVFVVSSLVLLQCARLFPDNTSINKVNNNSGLFKERQSTPGNGKYVSAPAPIAAGSVSVFNTVSFHSVKNNARLKLSKPVPAANDNTSLASIGDESWPANN